MTAAPSMAEVLARAEAAEAKVADLQRWKDEALPVMDGLQELGRALGLPLGERITGERALEAVTTLVAQVEAVRALADEWERNYAAMLIGGFSGCSIGADTAAKRIRAALDSEATP